jgi:NitT/TauT family transport system ATP-binding protein
VETAVDVRGLSLTFVTRAGEIVPVLRDVSLSVGRGEFVSLVGPSGCGKTSLFRVAAGIVPYAHGVVTVMGHRVSGAHGAAGIVFQGPTLLPWRSVIDNVILPLEKSNDGRARQGHGHARVLLARVGLGGFERAYPNELSGGMAQRVAICRALITDPPLLLMDEPFGALDAMAREQMNVELHRIWLEQRKTVFFITHSIPEAVFLSDAVYVMSRRPGHVLAREPVPFPHPRDFELTTTEAFGRVVGAIRHRLQATGHVD